MNGYIINFVVYTMAMVGIMFLSVLIYKKSTIMNPKRNGKNGMEIMETLTLSPKKTLHIVKVQNEKFLIASDLERTSFLAKLGENTSIYEAVAQMTPPAQSGNFASYLQNQGDNDKKSGEWRVESGVEAATQTATAPRSLNPHPNFRISPPAQSEIPPSPIGRGKRQASTPLSTLHSPLSDKDPYAADIEEMREAMRMKRQILQNRKTNSTGPVMRSLAQRVKLRRGT